MKTKLSKIFFSIILLNDDEIDVEVHKYAAKLLTEAKVNEVRQALLTTGLGWAFFIPLFNAF